MTTFYVYAQIDSGLVQVTIAGRPLTVEAPDFAAAIALLRRPGFHPIVAEREDAN